MKKLSITASTLIFFLITAALAFAGVEYPDETASEFPQYPGSEVVQVVNMGANLITILKCSNAQIKDAYNYYRDRAVKSKWKIAMETKQNEHMMFMAEKGKKKAMIDISQQDKEVIASITIVNETE
ncbi:MAG: hypothetical protein JXA35_05365 [Deltaproteobacteria bacterium]|nr:hypothetical protein [Deltaproteobacteria bacterium]